ncbi:hypothetical protein RND81_09G170700 [Saponaria officinalis]|uniref:50S ribosomal protein 6, chloroplastic n=1 Tax=Saponaria officinalis TaxID=3572 RepID=A0AAW1ILT6_SAPOF
MSVSAIFGTRLALPLLSGGTNDGAELKLRTSRGSSGRGLAVIEYSSRPQKKSTAHHMKTRPKKTQSWDIRRYPTVYAPLPPLPPEWTLVSSASEAIAPTPPPSPLIKAKVEWFCFSV